MRSASPAKPPDETETRGGQGSVTPVPRPAVDSRQPWPCGTTRVEVASQQRLEAHQPRAGRQRQRYARNGRGCGLRCWLERRCVSRRATATAGRGQRSHPVLYLWQESLACPGPPCRASRGRHGQEIITRRACIGNIERGVTTKYEVTYEVPVCSPGVRRATAVTAATGQGQGRPAHGTGGRIPGRRAKTRDSCTLHERGCSRAPLG